MEYNVTITDKELAMYTTGDINQALQNRNGMHYSGYFVNAIAEKLGFHSQPRFSDKQMAYPGEQAMLILEELYTLSQGQLNQ